jgi:hypothetical protein
MMLVCKGKRMLLLHRRTQTKHCWMLLLPKQMLHKPLPTLRQLKPTPRKLLLTLPLLKLTLIRLCWMPPPPLLLPDQRFLTLLTLPLETFLLELGQAPTPPLR